jgi:hypothetical protein
MAKYPKRMSKATIDKTKDKIPRTSAATDIKPPFDIFLSI